MNADQAFDLAVIEAGEAKLKLLGSAAGTTAGKMEMLRADFENANLKNANFENANFSNANFHGAIIDDANFKNTILIGSNITEEQLSKVASKECAILPDGTLFVSNENIKCLF